MTQDQYDAYYRVMHHYTRGGSYSYDGTSINTYDSDLKLLAEAFIVERQQLTDYYVNSDQPCPCCNGKGTIDHPLYGPSSTIEPNQIGFTKMMCLICRNGEAPR